MNKKHTRFKCKDPLYKNNVDFTDTLSMALLRESLTYGVSSVVLEELNKIFFLQCANKIDEQLYEIIQEETRNAHE